MLVIKKTYFFTRETSLIYCLFYYCMLFPIGLHDNVCFLQGGIGPVGNPGPQGVKGFQVSCVTSQVLISSSSFFFLISSELTGCVCVGHILQGVKGALGDPGLPGPTGIRGEFGERVSLTCLTVLNVTGLNVVIQCKPRHSTVNFLAILKIHSLDYEQ